MRLNLARLPAPQQLASLALIVGAVGLFIWAASRRVPAGSTLPAELAAGATNAAGQVAGGLVLGTGDAVGLPRTAPDRCAADLAAGRLWDASFSCPAGTFIGSFFGD